MQAGRRRELIGGDGSADAGCAAELGVQLPVAQLLPEPVDHRVEQGRVEDRRLLELPSVRGT